MKILYAWGNKFIINLKNILIMESFVKEEKPLVVIIGVLLALTAILLNLFVWHDYLAFAGAFIVCFVIEAIMLWCRESFDRYNYSICFTVGLQLLLFAMLIVLVELTGLYLGLLLSCFVWVIITIFTLNDATGITFWGCFMFWMFSIPWMFFAEL